MLAMDEPIKVWEGVYDSFSQAPRTNNGFHGQTYLERARASLEKDLAELRGGFVPESAIVHHYLLPGVVAALARPEKTLSILDFGGGMGSNFLTLRAVLGPNQHVRYMVVELENVCEAARGLLADFDEISFETALPDAGSFDLVHSGSALQYIEDWRGLLTRLAGYGASSLLFSDAMVGTIKTYVSTQLYYGAAIPTWFWSIDEFIDAVERHGYKLALRVPYQRRILGRIGAPPMSNLPAERRLPHTFHLLFHRA